MYALELNIMTCYIDEYGYFILVFIIPCAISHRIEEHIDTDTHSHSQKKYATLE